MCFPRGQGFCASSAHPPWRRGTSSDSQGQNLGSPPFRRVADEATTLCAFLGGRGSAPHRRIRPGGGGHHLTPRARTWGPRLFGGSPMRRLHYVLSSGTGILRLIGASALEAENIICPPGPDPGAPPFSAGRR